MANIFYSLTTPPLSRGTTLEGRDGIHDLRSGKNLRTEYGIRRSGDRRARKDRARIR